MTDYLDIAFTPAIRELQEHKGSRGLFGPPSTNVGTEEPHIFSQDEVAMITSRDSFYMATVSETGWPYVQHRGGEAGFVRALSPSTIGWAERSGNRQYIGTGNIVAKGRVAIIFIDYPSRSRLKLFGHATYHPDPSPDLIERLGGGHLRVDGAITVDVIGTMWNCPKFITPRFTESEVEQATAQLHRRIDELEAQLDSK